MQKVKVSHSYQWHLGRIPICSLHNGHWKKGVCIWRRGGRVEIFLSPYCTYLAIWHLYFSLVINIVIINCYVVYIRIWKLLVRAIFCLILYYELILIFFWFCIMLLNDVHVWLCTLCALNISWFIFAKVFLVFFYTLNSKHWLIKFLISWMIVLHGVLCLMESIGIQHCVGALNVFIVSSS